MIDHINNHCSYEYFLGTYNLLDAEKWLKFGNLFFLPMLKHLMHVVNDYADIFTQMHHMSLLYLFTMLTSTGVDLIEVPSDNNNATHTS